MSNYYSFLGSKAGETYHCGRSADILVRSRFRQAGHCGLWLKYSALREFLRTRMSALRMDGVAGLRAACCTLLTLAASVAFLTSALPGQAADVASENLAVKAHASAFEDYQGMGAALANDGRQETRWSGIPGHNVGGWFELDWQQPVRVGEVVVFQYDRYVKEMDVQIWDSTNNAWVTIEHLGSPDRRLPKVVVFRFAPRVTSRGTPRQYYQRPELQRGADL